MTKIASSLLIKLAFLTNLYHNVVPASPQCKHNHKNPGY